MSEKRDSTTPESVPEPRSRRAVLAAAIGGVAGMIAGRLGSPAATKAAAGDPIIMGAANNAGASNTTLSTNSAGTAFQVNQNGSGTALRGQTSAGIGVFGTSASGKGMAGTVTNPASFGVYGEHAGATGGAGAAIYAKGILNTGLLATTTNGSRNAITATGGNGEAAIYGTAIQMGVEGHGYRGVVGTTDDSGAAAGVHGRATGTSDVYGVFGYTNALTGNGIGVLGQSASNDTNGVGVKGLRPGSGLGVWGQSTDGSGLYGTSTNWYGLWVDGPTNLNGNTNVNGTLTKSSGSFKIDHPLDPANKWLYHSFVESPDMKNVYDGVATLDGNGEATVSLPAYFDALNSDVRYQLTAVGKAAPDLHVKSEVKSNKFSIAGGAAGQKVSWQVTGIRQDAYAKAHPIVAEVAKAGAEKGRYLHPKENGVAASKAMSAALSPTGRR